MRISIVGAGPAGLVAGLYLATIPGAKIEIHERREQRSYSSSLCAEGISIAALDRLKKDTGFDSSPYISKRVRGIRVVFPGGNDGFIIQEGATLDRTEWQRGMAAVLAQRKVKIRWGSAVTSPDQVDCDILVGADGPASKIRAAIGARAEIVPAVQYRMRIDRSQEFLEFFAGEMFHCGGRNDGYGWIFPKKECFNVGVKGDFKRLDRFLDRFGISGEILERAGAPVAVSGTLWEAEMGAKRVFLSGDAAGLTNPVTCGGLNPAIACGRFILQAIKKGKPGTYTSLVKGSGFDPAYWNRVRKLFYPSDKLLYEIGAILRGSRANPPSLAVLARMVRHPSGGLHCLRMLPGLHRLKRTSW